ncbi:MAG: hypothetical protein M3P30_13825 [Chloroflexota bacterium]|nr:hypothetical protein [Chloroflexota bacterium]
MDARIDVSPATATNDVNSKHTITFTIQQNDGFLASEGGDGVTGLALAPNGTVCTLSLLNNNIGASFVGGVNACGTSGGTCTVQINSSNAGSVDIRAKTIFTVGGLSLTRETGTTATTQHGVDAHKVYVDA